MEIILPPAPNLILPREFCSQLRQEIKCYDQPIGGFNLTVGIAYSLFEFKSAESRMKDCFVFNLSLQTINDDKLLQSQSKTALLITEI